MMLVVPDELATIMKKYLDLVEWDFWIDAQTNLFPRVANAFTEDKKRCQVLDYLLKWHELHMGQKMVEKMLESCQWPAEGGKRFTSFISIIDQQWAPLWMSKQHVFVKAEEFLEAMNEPGSNYSTSLTYDICYAALD